jgi:hypothetical protein
LKDIVQNNAAGLRDAIARRTVTDKRESASAVFTPIYKALAPDILAASELPPFEPTSAQVQTFLALWEGVKVT